MDASDARGAPARDRRGATTAQTTSTRPDAAGGSALPRTAALGRRFPVVRGTALSGERVRLPHDLLGAPALLLVAYRRQAQGDVDAWMAMARREAPGLRVVELPVIPAIIWRPLQGWIDGGMRGGVPRPQWSNVVTVYEDGAIVRDFVRDPGAPVATAVLLDAGGVVRVAETGGFSDAAAERLAAALTTLSHA